VDEISRRTFGAREYALAQRLGHRITFEHAERIANC
jgi:hypothetical protein